MKYRILDHTADFGIQVFGQSAQEVFIQAAYAMMEQIVNRKALEVKFENQLVIEGFDWPDLMVNWLRELLFLWSGNEWLMKRALINTLSPNRLSARMACSLLKDSPRSALYCCLAEKKRLRNTASSQLLVFRGISVMKEEELFMY